MAAAPGAESWPCLLCHRTVTDAEYRRCGGGEGPCAAAAGRVHAQPPAGCRVRAAPPPHTSSVLRGCRSLPSSQEQLAARPHCIMPFVPLYALSPALSPPFLPPWNRELVCTFRTCPGHCYHEDCLVGHLKAHRLSADKVSTKGSAQHVRADGHADLAGSVRKARVPQCTLWLWPGSSLQRTAPRPAADTS